MNDRDLSFYTAERMADEKVTLLYAVAAPVDEPSDGSENIEYAPQHFFASVTSLQKNEIQRMAIKGIVAQNGITVVIPGASVNEPDRVIRKGDTYRTIDFNNDTGITVLTCDRITVGHAEATL